MIKHLYIQNFILIESLNLDFEDGFHAFVGETGAGKSILIDAISLLCADRASTNFVGKKADRTIVEGTFSLGENAHAVEVLTDAGFDVNEETVFTREINKNGKSTTRIDHRIVTLNLMKDVLRDEIDIHGQRDTQYLLNPSSHIHLLDAFINEPKDLEKLKEAYVLYKELLDEKEAALNSTYNESDYEFFQYQLSEIEQANLNEEEEEELLLKEKQFKAIKSSYEKLQQSITLYDSIDSQLYEMHRLINGFNDELTEETKQHITDGYYSLSDGMEEVKKMVSELDVSEDTINAMEERLFDIQRIKRKYGGSIAAVFQKKQELTQAIDMMKNRETFLKEIDERIEKAKDAYLKIAKRVSKKRNEMAKKLDTTVIQQLHDLSLPNASFATQIEEIEPTAKGIDQVQFLIRMNKGEDLKPLHKTASGGELSRLMLGLKVIFTKLQGIHTVIFDEIDTGVSGKVADAIGKKMKQLSKDTQVISVTHLAPVAANADTMYLVDKQETNNTTTTIVHKLNEQEEIEQLAFIATGSTSDSALKAASELRQASRG